MLDLKGTLRYLCLSRPPRSYEVEVAEDGSTAVLRNVSLKEKNRPLIYSPVPEEVQTLHDVLVWSKKSFGEYNCIGWRDRLNEVIEEKEIVEQSPTGEEIKRKREWRYYRLSGYKWLKSQEFIDLVTLSSSGLCALGIQPGERLMIFSRTSYRWLQMAHSCWRSGIVLVTAYEALDSEGIKESIVESDVRCVFVDGATCSKLLGIVDDLKLDVIIYSSDLSKKFSAEERNKLNKCAGKVLSINELEDLGRKQPSEAYKCNTDDVCCVMYTSGTSSSPKGVMLSHRNMLSAIAGAQSVVDGLESKNDSYIAYLPLSHVLECVIENVCLFYGIPIGYGSIWTLTKDSVRDCKSDLEELCPTIMAGVPAVWESMKRNINLGVAQSPFIKRAAFHFFFNLKYFLMRLNVPVDVFDKFIFKRIREPLGGKLRFALNGGAPVHYSTKKFVGVAAVKILNGYGLTETCGMGAIQFHEDSIASLDSVGPPTTAVEIKLVSVPELGYSVKEKEPCGEVHIRGPAVMKGYLKKPELTEQVLSKDGWFKTGDIARLAHDGTFSIIDRVKNLIKLSNGEYISLEKLECIYKTSEYVENICIVTNPQKSYIIAITSPVEISLLELAKSLNIVPHNSTLSTISMQSICADKKLVKAVLDKLSNLAVKANLSKSEKIANILIYPAKWTPENKFLTAAFKISRRNVAEICKNEINKMFS